jgi:hypothetical protein
MGRKLREKRNRHYEGEFVAVDDIYVPERTMERILRKDSHQIEKMRGDFEDGYTVVRVVLRPRFGGGYNVEDGRHRVIAAKLAGEAYIEAIIVGE